MATQFGKIDFIVFIGMLVISLSIGVFYAIKDRNKNDVRNYNYGGKKMPPLAVGMSIAVSYISALTIVSLPTEAYLFGTITAGYIFNIFIAKWIAFLYYIPLVHRLKLYTIYQFLELRFHKRNRTLCACFGLVRLIFYMGICLYLPALSLNAVTPLSLYGSIATVGVVCTFYTTLGGMKAVIWTDVVQTVIMFAGSLAAMTKIIIDVGGVYEVQKGIQNGDRNNFFDFNPNPFLQRTLWTLSVGLGFAGMQQTCTQLACQRYMSCKSIKHARRALMYSILPAMTFTSMGVITGYAMYVYFEGCDPVKNGDILKNDQLMPYLVLKIFHNTPGMAGLFVSAAFSGTFSTVSSGINTVSALILEDVLGAFIKNRSDKTKVIIGKMLSIFIGVVVMSIAFLSSKIDGTVISIVISVSSCVSGPIIAVVTLGMCTPWCTSVGAFVGQLIGTACSVWVMIGSKVYGKMPESVRLLPLSIDQCDVTATSNWTTSVTSSTPHQTSSYEAWSNVSIEYETEKPALYYSLYSLSFALYFLWGFLITITFSLIVSFATGANKASECNPKYFVPMIDNKILPEKIRTFFRFGVPKYEFAGMEREEMKNLNQDQS